MPEGEHLAEYLKWDDWRVLGRLADGEGGEAGRRLCERDHYREVFHTPENPKPADMTRLQQVCEALGDKARLVESAEKSWYKIGEPDIPVLSDNPGVQLRPLSEHSDVIAGMKPIRRQMVFCRPEEKDEAIGIVTATGGGET